MDILENGLLNELLFPSLLGEISDQWSNSKLKYIGYLYGGLTGKSASDFNQDDNPQNKSFITFTNIYNNIYILQDNLGKVIVLEDENQNVVKQFDLFFLMSSETQEDVGKSSVLKDDIGEVYLNSFCRGFRIINNECDPLFVNYLLNSYLYREILSVEGRGFTRINLRSNNVNDLRIYYPPIPEQKQIVYFLDYKTQKIDELIEKTEQKIELLKEKRTSLINHCVTKGLNPNVEMKDSGVEWIGEIPKHWKMKKVKFLLNDFYGIKIGPFGSSLKLDTLTESGIKVYGQGNVIKDDFNIGHRYLSLERFEEDFIQYEILDGDVLVTMMGTTGKSKVFRCTYERGILDSHLLRLRFNKSKFSSYLFSILLEKSDYVFQQIKLSSKGSIMEGLNSSIIKELKIITPPIREQIILLENLATKTQKIDTTIKKETQRIELLKEYRQSLISEVVTGKIDVRDEVVV